MSDSEKSPTRRLLLADSVERDGKVLAHALTSRGWTVTRTEHPRGIARAHILATDTILLALDGDDAEVFELLLQLSSLPRRPTVVLMTRRANARVLVPDVLASLGIDRVIVWPARIEQIATAIDAAQREHELAGGMS